MTKKEVKTPKVKTPEVEIPVVETQEVETPEVKTPEDEIEVGNPIDLRPKELPLVVKTPKGGWKNEQQEKFAKTLNAYAYSNTTKWGVKKDVLIARLVEIGKDPQAFHKYAGLEDGVMFN